jgi:hypothetical protein
METILWKFEGKEVSYYSTPNKLERDIVRMALANNLEVDHKIKILYDGRINTTMPSNSNGDTSCPTVDTLYLGLDKIKPGKKAIQLRDVSGDVDQLDGSSSIHESSVDMDCDSSASDSVSE